MALMVKNAQTYNRPMSTIHKDSIRIYNTFQTAMKEEMNTLKSCPTYNIVEIDSDEDEEEAWSRDLRQRSHLAFYERSEYQKIHEKLAAERAQRGKPQIPRELIDFTDRTLVLRWVQPKMVSHKKTSHDRFSREDFAQESSELTIGDGNHRHSSSWGKDHDITSCEVCRPIDDELPQQQVHDQTVVPPVQTPSQPMKDVVLTPSFRELYPPAPTTTSKNKKLPSSARKSSSQARHRPGESRLTGPKRTKLLSAYNNNNTAMIS
jgi:hypothetical protein